MPLLSFCVPVVEPLAGSLDGATPMTRPILLLAPRVGMVMFAAGCGKTDSHK